jgi:GNAT superfamily N-acetyltransferase
MANYPDDDHRDYHIREATLDDMDVLVRHRLAMFTDMGRVFDAPLIAQMFRDWVRPMMSGGDYHAWLCETGAGDVAGGAALTLIKWPPGPSPLKGDRAAFVYNGYTEHAHRRRGVARRLMETLHAWCADHGIGAIALNASSDARQLYESMGYQVAASPMMWKIT